MKKLNLLALLALSTLLIIAMTIVSAGSDPLVPDSSSLKVSLIAQSPDPAEPGDIVELSIKFENNGTGVIRNLQAEIIPEFPFSLPAGEENVKYIGSLGPINSVDFRDVEKFKVKIAGDAASGTSFVDVKFTSEVLSGIVRNIPVAIRTKEAVLDIPLIILQPPAISPGKSSLVSIVLENNARSTLRNIRFTLDLPAKFATIGSSSTKFISRLEPGANTSVDFQLYAESETIPAVHKIPFRLNYEDEANNPFSKNGTIGITVNTLPDYSLNLEDTAVYTKTGTGKIVLSISNTGAANMRFTLLELLDTNEYEVISAPRVYLGNLEPDDFETAEFNIHTTGKAKNAVNLKARVVYKDDFSQEFTDEKNVGMKIYSGSEAKSLGLLPKGKNIVLSFITSIGIPLLILAALAYLLVDLKKHKVAKYQKLLWAVVIISVVGAPAYYWFVMRRKQKQAHS